MKLLLAALGALLVAVLGGFVWLMTLDTGVYQRTLQKELSSLLGRPVSIGAVSFEWALRPTLQVRDLRIANPAWASRADFLTVTEAEARVDLAALWKGRVQIQAVQLDGVDLLLERDPSGQGNWVFGTPANADKPMALPDIHGVTLAATRIGWRQADGAVLQGFIDSAETAIVDGIPFQFTATGRFRATPLALTLKADASLQRLLQPAPWQLAIGIRQQDAALAIDLRRPSIDAAEGFTLGVEATGERLAAWAGIAGHALPDWGPYSVSAQSRLVQGRLDVQTLKLSLDGLPTAASRLEISQGRMALGGGSDSQWRVEGRLGDAPLSVAGSSGPWPRPAEATPAMPLTLQLALAQLSLDAQGTVDAADDRFDLALQARGDALGALTALAGVRGSEPLPIELSAQVARGPQGYDAKAIRGRLLGVPLSGHLAWERRAPHVQLSGALDLGRLSLDHPGLRALGIAPAPKPAARSGTQGHPSVPPWPDALQADLSLRIAALGGLPFTARDLAARLQWRDDTLQLQQVAATLDGTRIAGDGTLRWRDGRTQFEGAVDVALLDLGKLGGGTPSRGGPRSAMNQPLPVAPLRAIDGRLRIGVARVVGAPVAIGKLAATAQLQGGKLDVDLGAGTVSGIPLRGRIAIDASGDAWRVDANAQADRIDLAALVPPAGRQPATVTGTLQATHAELASQGRSAHELLANARLSVRTDPFALQWPRDKFRLSVDRAAIDVEPGAPLQLSAAGQAFDTPVDLTLTGGRLAELAESATAWPRIEARLRSTLKGQAFQVDASSGPLQRLLGLRDVPLAIKATAPGAQLSLEGQVRNLAQPAATPLAARLQIADLARTAALFTATPLPALRVEATGRLTPGTGMLSVAGLAAQIGKSDAAGQLQLRWRDQPKLSATLNSKLIDLTQWERATDKDAQPLLDRPIPIGGLLAQDLQLNLRTERLLLHKFDLSRVQLDATLEKGLVQLSAQAAEGDLSGQLRFDIRNRTPGLALRLQLKEVDSRTLYTGPSAPGRAAPPLISMRAQLAGTGASLRRMLATANGAFLLTAGAGTLPVNTGFGFERIAGNLLLTLVPGRRAGEFDQLECAAAHFAIANGVATSSDGIVLRLQRMDILGSGAANLTNGQILFGYRAVRRSFFSMSLLGLTSGIARVTGTLNNPSVELDPSGVLLAGTAAWATAGVSLLAGELWRKLEATGDPCARIAGGARLPDDPLDALLGALRQ